MNMMKKEVTIMYETINRFFKRATFRAGLFIILIAILEACAVLFGIFNFSVDVFAGTVCLAIAVMLLGLIIIMITE